VTKKRIAREKKKKKPLLEIKFRCGCVVRRVSIKTMWRIAEAHCGSHKHGRKIEPWEFDVFG